MSILTARTKTDLGAAAACVALGGIFAIQSWRIPIDPHAIVSSRFVPLFLSLAIACLGVLLAAIAMVRAGRSGNDEAAQPGFGFEDAHLGQVLLIVGCGTVFVVTFWAVGFLVATLTTLLVTLIAFGNRNWRTIAILSVSGAIVYQLIFMRFMILDDPVGALIDASALSAIFSSY